MSLIDKISVTSKRLARVQVGTSAKTTYTELCSEPVPMVCSSLQEPSTVLTANLTKTYHWCYVPDTLEHNYCGDGWIVKIPGTWAASRGIDGRPTAIELDADGATISTPSANIAIPSTTSTALNNQNPSPPSSILMPTQQSMSSPKWYGSASKSTEHPYGRNEHIFILNRFDDV
ncbi:uncharacterized protein PV09_01774 [Verruconis gallopava]|uniref:Uncharacterized protein n=1 Tax=Verruconis gallopava TaxID=253628 RepID=A0A0D2B9D1_9PEZI|nr:uncharacterized protein PV09_01774 [Verruconis gallopava]KIW07859.1 hypothetical protein PV09_01774 [Verruconis gallopava]